MRSRPGGNPKPLSSSGVEPSGFVAAMLPEEQERMNACLIKFPDTCNLCISIAQDPEFCSSGAEVMHCLVCNCHIQWSQIHGCWLFARNMARLQGFPTCNSDVSACCGRRLVFPLCSFKRSRCQSNLPPRSRTAMTQQICNSMNVNIIGSILMWLHYFRRPVVCTVPPAQLSSSDSRIGAWRHARSASSAPSDALAICDDDAPSKASNSSLNSSNVDESQSTCEETMEESSIVS